MTTKLIDYRLCRPGAELGPVSGALYEYVFGETATYLRAARTGLEICLPLGSHEPVRGLADPDSCTQMPYPRVDAGLVEWMLETARAAKDPSGMSLEILFYLYFEDGIWNGIIPVQEQAYASCKPVCDSDPYYQKSLIEVHSHHNMKAFFSGTDDRDEQGFKIYGVLGTINTQPTLRLRVGCYGYFFDLDPAEIFELPDVINSEGETYANA